MRAEFDLNKNEPVEIIKSEAKLKVEELQFNQMISTEGQWMAIKTHRMKIALISSNYNCWIGSDYSVN